MKFDAEKGFFLNGKSVKLKGTCNHQDHAGLGAALPDAVQYYRIRKLQEMGCNSLRTSHNPPTPELLDACDELGMLVFDETRMMSSNPEGLSQFENLVRRDRNHPSVFMWSMGNEEGQANTEKGLHILTAMKAVATEYDGSRPVSIAPIRAIGVGGLVECDVMGYNYMDPGAEAYHKAHPDKPVIGTETVSAVGTRGIYITDPDKGYVGSYDPYTTTGRASAEGWWSFCNARPWLAGGFVWTGFDYRGEPSPNEWPNISSQYGIIDTCGFPKDSFYYYQSWWTTKPVLHLFPHWNWPGMEGQGNRGLGLLEPGQGGTLPQRRKPGREGNEEGLASGVDRQVRSRRDRGARLQERRAGDDGKARNHGAGGEAGDEGRPRGGLRRTAKTWPCSRLKFTMRKAAWCRSPTTK